MKAIEVLKSYFACACGHAAWRHEGAPTPERLSSARARDDFLPPTQWGMCLYPDCKCPKWHGRRR